MNRRGDASVLVFVVLVLLVCGIALFSFVYSSKRASIEIFNSNLIEAVYAEQSDLNFYIREKVDSVYLKTYSDFVSNGRYLIGDQILLHEDRQFFYFILLKDDASVNSEFKASLKDNLKSISFSENEILDSPQLKIIQDKFANGDFLLDGPLENFNIVFADIPLKSNFKKENLNVTYLTDISLNYNLKEFGLVSFSYLNSLLASCSNGYPDERFSCLEKTVHFPSFYTEVFRRKDSKGKELPEVLVRMTSREQFLIDGSMQNIYIRFFVL